MNVERRIDDELAGFDRLPGWDETEEESDARIARARASVAAGRGVPHEEVAKWLQTWGTADSGPPPQEWFE